MVVSVSQKQQSAELGEPRTKQPRLVVCLTGMPGAGKSTIAEVSERMGFEVFRMGDDVRMEAERRKIPPSDENLGAVMLQLRQSGGPVAVAALCKQRIERSAKSRFIVIDGIRNINEFLEFRKLGEASLISVLASPTRRFEFLMGRGRSDSPASFQAFEARDRRELSVGIGEAIAMSDEIIANSGTLVDLRAEASKLLQKLKNKSKIA